MRYLLLAVWLAGGLILARRHDKDVMHPVGWIVGFFWPVLLIGFGAIELWKRDDR